MEDRVPQNSVLPVEIFAAKDNGELFIAVPCKCGLKQADTLRVKGLVVVALKDRSILPIDLPELTEESRGRLLNFAAKGKQIPVGEFMARGLFDAYFLDLVVV